MITIDIETKSDKDISKCGVYAYADSPYFDILLFAYSIDGQPVQVVDTAKGEEIPQEQQISVTDAMDVMIRWFCLLFGNQFSPDDVLDGYPVDRLMHDIALALMAVQTQTTEILSQFPTKAAKEPTPPQPATEAEEIPLF